MRHLSSRCFSATCSVLPVDTLISLLDGVLPLLGDTSEDRSREGAVEAIYNVVEAMKINIVPYVVLIVVPILGKQSLHSR